MSEKPIVVVAGAAGRAGRLIVKEALERGFRVRALLVRPFDPPRLEGLEGPDLELVEGDFSSMEGLDEALSGADYLISAIGSTRHFSAREFEKIDVRGNRNLARAAREKNLRRMVVISSIGAGDSKDAMKCVFRLLMGQVIRWKTRLEEEIKKSGIDYTIIRPGGYTNRPLSGRIALGEGGKISGLINREQVARVCVDAVADDAMKNRTIEVVDASRVRQELRQHIINFN